MSGDEYREETREKLSTGKGEEEEAETGKVSLSPASEKLSCCCQFTGVKK